MSYAIINNGIAYEITGSFIDANEIQHPYSVLQLWTEAELLEIGVHRIVENEVPDNLIIVGSELVIDNDIVRRVYATEEIDLEQEKNNRKAIIDSQAEATRQKYITQGAGQAMTYQSKAAEAIRYHETNGQGDYPFLSEEVGITGDTLADVAATVLTMHHEWQIIGAQIERERLAAKKAVELATTVTDLNNIKPVWP